jgi:hypothetical protein
VACTHLLWQSDADGFCAPLSFPDVIDPYESLHIAGRTIGAVPLLLEECRRLSVVAVPADLDPESEELLTAAEEQGHGAGRGPLWQRYAAASFTCLQLIRDCTRSIETGATLVFT